MRKTKTSPTIFFLSFFSNSLSLCSNSLSRCRERVRVRDICVARMSGAPHIFNARKLRKVPHPPFADERRPLPTQGEAIQEGEPRNSNFIFFSVIAGACI
jgi:hypothetical protein